jgi:hypothetical protein
MGALLDNFIRSQQQRWWDGETEGLGGLEVNHEVELRQEEHRWQPILGREIHDESSLAKEHRARQHDESADLLARYRGEWPVEITGTLHF